MTEIMMLVLTGGVGLLGWYFKRDKDRLDCNDKNLQGQIEGVKKDLSDYRLEAQREFVTKDEFVRAVTNQDRKLDKIYDEIMKLNGKRGSA